MMTIAPPTLVPVREDVKGEYGGINGEMEGNTDYGGMMQPVNKMLHHV